MLRRIARLAAAHTLLALASTGLLLSAPASAHTLGEGYLFINVLDDGLDGWLEITLTDLDRALGLDADTDGKVSEAELEANMPRVRSYVSERIAVGTPDGDYELRFTGHEIRQVPLGRYLALFYEIGAVSAVPDVLRFRYEMLFEEDPNHRGFLVIARNMKTGVINEGEETTLVFAPDTSVQTMDLTAISWTSSFITFVKHGIWHIWIGVDHILFLLALLLPAVLTRRDGRWQPVTDRGPAIWNVVKIVTLFTIAHTITLSLAVLDVVGVPSRLVESVIAASVVVAALNNVWPLLRERIGFVVFGFGLFHGFGFASVLQHLVTNRSNLVVDLLGFNVGVELGQLAVVLVAFPIMLAIRRTGFYLRVLLPAGSVVIALLALGWFTERALDVDFLPI